MRSIRYSRTFTSELAKLLEQGRDGFGDRVVAQSAERTRYAIESYILPHPVRPIDRDIGICAYHASRTPFVILYDYDDLELRFHLVIHVRADRTQIDLSAIEW